MSVCAAAQRGGEVWPFLQKNYDADKNGSITAEEYGRGERAFQNLDKNGDGVITRADFGRGARRRGGRGSGPGPGGANAEASQKRFIELFATFIDRDRKPGIGEADWRAMIGAMQPAEDGAIERENLANFLGDAAEGRMAGRATRMIGRGLDLDDSGAVDAGDLEALFGVLDRDENGVLDRADGLALPPSVGEVAPDFTLPLAADKDEEGRTVTLSAFKGSKPVALIFGSYT